MKNEQGVTAIEYGLIGALISIAIIGSVTLTGTNTKEVFCSVDTSLSNGQNNCELLKDSKLVSSNYVDASLGLGGTGAANHQNIIGNPGGDTMVNNTLSVLDSINADDPIESVFGVYDIDKKPITNYNQLTSYLKDNMDNGEGGSVWSYYQSGMGAPYFEVVTQSGATYGLQRDQSGSYQINGINMSTQETEYSAQ